MLKRRITVFILCLMVLASSLAFSLGKSSPEDRYNQAIELLQEGDFTSAAPIFQELGHYLDAGKYAMYTQALAKADAGNYALAATTMSALSGFMDSQLQASYYTGRALEAIQEYEEAGEVYEKILLFRDVTDRYAALPLLILQRDYAAADSREKQGDAAADLENRRSHYVRAKSAFAQLGSYSDSQKRVATLTEKINAVDYAAADSL